MCFCFNIQSHFVLVKKFSSIDSSPPVLSCLCKSNFKSSSTVKLGHVLLHLSDLLSKIKSLSSRHLSGRVALRAFILKNIEGSPNDVAGGLTQPPPAVHKSLIFFWFFSVCVCVLDSTVREMRESLPLWLRAKVRLMLASVTAILCVCYDTSHFAMVQKNSPVLSRLERRLDMEVKYAGNSISSELQCFCNSWGHTCKSATWQWSYHGNPEFDCFILKRCCAFFLLMSVSLPLISKLSCGIHFRSNLPLGQCIWMWLFLE